MKRRFVCAIAGIVSMINLAIGQNVAINNTNATPHASALLDIASTSKGLLTPRMNTSQRAGIVSPAQGLLVYDTQLNEFMYYTGSAWQSVKGDASNTHWKLGGNNSIDASQHFIGTIDQAPLHFRINNLKSGRLDISGNAFYGLRAGMNNTSGNKNIAIGFDALFSNETTSSLIAVGDSALFENTTGTQNTAVGSNALSGNTSGDGNSAFGINTLKHNNNGNENSAFGSDALHENYGHYNSAFGASALASMTNGYSNTAMGTYAGILLESAHENTLVGFAAMNDCEDCGYNTALGARSMLELTEGLGNTAVGYAAMETPNNGFYNSAFGYSSSVSQGFFNSTAIGAFAKVEASNSIVLGSVPGEHAQAPNPVKVGIGTTSPQNRLHVAGGTDANLDNGSGYLQLGSQTSTNVIFDDNEILARNNGVEANLYLQASGGNVKIGSTSAPSHLLELASNSAAKPGSNTWTIISDSRLKTDITPFSDGLEIIRQVNPVRFRYNGEAGITDKSVFVGILAQEIKEIAPYMVSEFNYTDADNRTDTYYSYDGNAMIYLLINAIKEQQQQIDALTVMVEQLTDDPVNR